MATIITPDRLDLDQAELVELDGATLDDDAPEQEEAEEEDENDDGLANLTPQQLQVIALLSQGQSVSAVARAIGVHRTTIHHWSRTNPAFALALRDSERDTANHWRCATQARAEKALTALDSLLDNERTPATVRLKAILHVLNTATTIPPAPAADPLEQNLLAREQQQRQKERGRVIDQMLDDAEALHNMSHEEYLSMLYDGETEEERRERWNQYQEASQPDEDTEDDAELLDLDDDDLEEEVAEFEDEDLPEPAAIHHNSSLFAKSPDCRNDRPDQSKSAQSPQPNRQT